MKSLTDKQDLALMAGLTALALVLRLWHINADLWLDEIMTLVEYMRSPPYEAALTYNSANQHLLNSVLGSVSIHTLGESTWTIRLPALFFGVATIPVFFLLAREVTERREAVFATLFLTLSYHHVWFSQNARGYSGMIFFTVLSTLFLVRWLSDSNDGGRRNLLWYSISGALGMMSLLNFAFVLSGQFLVALYQLVESRRWSRIRLLIVSGVMIVVLTLLGYAATLPAINDYFYGGGDGTTWQDLKSFSTQLEAGWAMLIAGLTIALPMLAVPALIFAAAIAISGWFSYLKSMRFIALMLVVPAAFNMALLAQLNWIVFPRSFLYIMPFGILIIIRGAFVLGEWLVLRFGKFNWAVFVLPVLMILGSLVILPHNYRYPKQNSTGSLAYAQAQAAPDDVIAVVGYLDYGYRFYFNPDLAFPRSVEELEALRGPDHRVWVLNSYSQDMQKRLPEIRSYLQQEFQLEQTFPGTLGDGDVYLRVSRLPTEP